MSYVDSGVAGRDSRTSFTPSLPQLKAFVAVADLKHFGDAAAHVGVSQPTLSQALASLEAGLELQLVERTTRRVLVTDAGQRLLPAARAVVDALEAFVEAAAEDRGWLTGRLRLGVIPTVAPYLLPGLLRALRREAPALRPEIREDQTSRLLEALRVGTLDVALLALPAGAGAMLEVPVYDEDFVLVVPEDHPWAGRTDLPVEALRDAPLLLLDEGHCLRDQALDLCRQVGAQPSEVAARATSLPTVVQLVAAGLGVTLLPGTAVPVELRRGSLGVARFADDPPPGRRIGLVFRASSARAEEFEDLAEIVRRAVRTARLPARLVGAPVGSAHRVG